MKSYIHLFTLIGLLLLPQLAFAQAFNNTNILVKKGLAGGTHTISEYTLSGALVKSFNVVYPTPVVEAGFTPRDGMCGSEYVVANTNISYTNTSYGTMDRTFQGVSFYTPTIRGTGGTWTHIAAPPELKTGYFAAFKSNTRPVTCGNYGTSYYLDPISGAVYETSYAGKTIKKLFSTGVQNAELVELGSNQNLFVLNRVLDPQSKLVGLTISQFDLKGLKLSTTNLLLTSLPNVDKINANTLFSLAVSRDHYFLGYTSGINTTNIVKLNFSGTVLTNLPLAGILGDVQVRNDNKLIFSYKDSVNLLVGVSDTSLSAISYINVGAKDTATIARIDFVDSWVPTNNSSYPGLF